MTTQVLEALRAEARTAEQAHMEAVAAAKTGEAQLWRQRLQHAEAASQQQVWQEAQCRIVNADKDDWRDTQVQHRAPVCMAALWAGQRHALPRSCKHCMAQAESLLLRLRRHGAQVAEVQGKLQSAQAEIDSLEGQLRQHRQRAKQLLSALAATADISAPVQDALSASEERPTAFSAAVQQLCSQVLGTHF